MAKRMLIDSTHAEETRVVVLDNNRLEDFDVETSTKKQLKGNIYLAKIVRVEPSLQAAFVEFGGGRHGFLAFAEIHPDYYQIPVADRRRLLEMQEAEAREEEEAEEREAARQDSGNRRRQGQGRNRAVGDAAAAIEAEAGAVEPGEILGEAANEALGDDAEPVESAEAPPSDADVESLVEAGYATQADPEGAVEALPAPSQVAQPAAIAQDILIAPEEARALFPDAGAEAEGADMVPPALGADIVADAGTPDPEAGDVEATQVEATPEPEAASEFQADATDAAPAEDEHDIPRQAPPESMGGEHEVDEHEEQRAERSTPRFLRNYKIQEVMRRRQILLIQVVKEERGTKGAALTTYISLAGRFSVLMPNSPRGGGISRKITSAADRRRLKEITAELDLPRGMGLIVRTAGANRPRPEIIRDCEYLLNQWDQIRDLTMRSMAPALIYEEASLIKRAIRDVYSREVDDILVDGEEGWRAARDFMRMLMPTHARKVQLWKDPQPLFAKAQVEDQLDSMLLPTVQLRSGGYLVINQTEALVAIDVNSGRSTRERGIEETAVRTNLEAAEEAARQLRLRDLAGLIVIDFIDMESRRNNAAVEKKLKDSLKNDRARIQVGSISHFGLLEMSRQRLRPSLAETSFVACAHCGGTGLVRSTESAALHVLRGIEDEGAKRRAAEIVVHVAGAIAFYILNHKRVRLAEIEQRFGLVVTFQPDESLLAPDMRIERVRAQTSGEAPAPISQLAPPEPFEDPDEEIAPEAADDASEDDEEAVPGETAEDGEARTRGKRRRRRRGGRREDGAREDAPRDDAAAAPAIDLPEPGVGDALAAIEPGSPEIEGEPIEPSTEPTLDAAPDASLGEDGERKRRGRRGGRRRRRGEAPLPGEESAEGSDAPEAAPVDAYAPPAYVGPTPADPFGGSNAFDFFDAVEQAEQRAMSPVIRSEDAVQSLLPEAAMSPIVQDEALMEATTDVAPAAMAPVIQSEAEVQAVVDTALDVTTTPEPEVAAPLVAPEPEPVPEPEPEPEPAPINPALIPTMIGAPDAAPAEKKRGWWRR